VTPVLAAIPLWAPAIVLAIAVVWGLLDDRRARRSLLAWSSANKYRLVEYHRAAPWQAPHMYWRGNRIVAWRVTLDDAHGARRTGLVRFMFLFPGFRDPTHVDVAWDDSARR
jgi:hypothetical protein